MRAYRDPDAKRKTPFLALPLLLFALLPLVGLQISPPDWTGLAISAVFIAAAVIVYVGARTHWRDVGCVEVRLDDDGMCELETADHVTRVHVSEIRAVEYSRSSESGAETYVIRHRTGKAQLGGRTTDFGDFLRRLTALNPAVDVSSFPAVVTETLPAKTSEPTRTPLEAFLRSGVLPLAGILLVVYLTGQTFLK